MVNEFFRRSPHMVCYWQGRQLIFENYATRRRIGAAPVTCELLHFFDRWRAADSLRRHFPLYTSASLNRAVARLVRSGLLERSCTPRDFLADAFLRWKDWSPAACFFHFTTKDAHVAQTPEDSVRALRRRARQNPMPASLKRYPGAKQIVLPAPEVKGEFSDVLLRRRTWRRFSRRPLEVKQLSTLLGLSFGVQWWVDLRGIGRVALKTSPSGGARHPIEAYVLALQVRGLPRGLYHYNAGAHRLEMLRRGAQRAQVTSYLNGQSWFSAAAAVVLMTGVFARTQWKYPSSRAYRVVLADAGHLCQTFCLVATWLGLAPFSTMAMADTRIERALEIDGITESVLYASGVGLPPAGSQWQPWAGSVHGVRRPNAALHPVQ
ncbi:MAG: SagB family peptide dehydrogenase [Candidatus Acidiferrales bacterium]